MKRNFVLNFKKTALIIFALTALIFSCVAISGLPVTKSYADVSDAQGLIFPDGIQAQAHLVWEERKLEEDYPDFTYVAPVHGDEVYITVIELAASGYVPKLSFALVFDEQKANYSAYEAITDSNLAIVQENGAPKKFTPEGISTEGKGIFFNLLNNLSVGKYILRMQIPQIRDQSGNILYPAIRAEKDITVCATYSEGVAGVNGVRIISANVAATALQPDAATGRAEISFSYGYAEKLIRTLRPEHGNTLYLRVVTPEAGNRDKISSTEFGLVLEFNANGTISLSELVYTSPAEDNLISEGELYAKGNPITDSYYLINKLNALAVGNYVMVAHAEATEKSLHTHWWASDGHYYNSACEEMNLIVDLTVGKYDLGELSGKISVENSWQQLKYTGEAHTPVPVLKYNGQVIPASDYTLTYQNNIDASINAFNRPLAGKDTPDKKPSIIITPVEDSDFTGVYRINFDILQSDLIFTTTPTVTGWKYGEFNGAGITAEVSAGGSVLPSNFVRFTVYWNETRYPYKTVTVKFNDGTTEKEYFNLNADGSLPEFVANTFAGLPARTYYLKAACNYADYEEFYNPNFGTAECAAVEFAVESSANAWVIAPAAAGWTYGEFGNPETHFTAVPAFPANGAAQAVQYKILIETDGNYSELAVYDDGKDYFSLGANGKFSNEVVAKISALNAGNYYLFATVPADANGGYGGLNTDSDDLSLVQFIVLKAQNSWTVQPAIKGWTYGEYDETVNNIVAEAKYRNSELEITVKGKSDGKTYYHSANGAADVNLLASLSVGNYTLTCAVAGNENYGELNYSVDFKVTAAKKKTGCRAQSSGAAGGVALLIIAAAVPLISRRRKNSK